MGLKYIRTDLILPEEIEIQIKLRLRLFETEKVRRGAGAVQHYLKEATALSERLYAEEAKALALTQEPKP